MRKYAIALVVLLVSLRPGSATACTCGIYSPRVEFNRSTVVFVGRVDSVQSVSDFADVVHFAVSRSWTQRLGRSVNVLTSPGGGSCGYPVSVGESYLIFASLETGAGGLWMSLCSNNRRLSEAEPLLRMFGPPLVQHALGSVEPFVPTGEGTRTRSADELQGDPRFVDFVRTGSPEALGALALNYSLGSIGVRLENSRPRPASPASAMSQVVADREAPIGVVGSYRDGVRHAVYVAREGTGDGAREVLRDAEETADGWRSTTITDAWSQVRELRLVSTPARRPSIVFIGIGASTAQILVSEREGGRWREPEALAISHDWISDLDADYDADGTLNVVYRRLSRESSDVEIRRIARTSDARREDIVLFSEKGVDSSSPVIVSPGPPLRVVAYRFRPAADSDGSILLTGRTRTALRYTYSDRMGRMPDARAMVSRGSVAGTVVARWDGRALRESGTLRLGTLGGPDVDLTVLSESPELVLLLVRREGARNSVSVVRLRNGKTEAARLANPPRPWRPTPWQHAASASLDGETLEVYLCDDRGLELNSFDMRKLDWFCPEADWREMLGRPFNPEDASAIQRLVKPEWQRARGERRLELAQMMWKNFHDVDAGRFLTSVCAGSASAVCFEYWGSP